LNNDTEQSVNSIDFLPKLSGTPYNINSDIAEWWISMFCPNVTDIQQEDRTNHYSDSKFLSPKMHAGKPLGCKSVVPVKPLVFQISV